jgi:uncharacterized protein
MNTVQFQKKVDDVCKRIAPSWPLENSVAVNPYLGFSDVSFDRAAQLFQERGGIRLYMPISFYLEQINNKTILNIDIEKALLNKDEKIVVQDFLDKLSLVDEFTFNKNRFSIFSDFVFHKLNTDFSDTIINHTSSWLSSYFNKFHKKTQTFDDMFLQWKTEMKVDLFPRYHGINNFNDTINKISDDPEATIIYCLRRFKIPEFLIDAYLHSLLLRLLGWSSYCSGIDWQNNLYEGKVNCLKSLLAILITWELSLLNQFNELEYEWIDFISLYDIDFKSEELFIQSTLQDAYDLGFQRSLKLKLDEQSNYQDNSQTKNTIAQMVFCIDVRSEVLRRKIEAIDSRIETIGFAGFFGFPIKYTPLNHLNGKNQCPVLIPSSSHVYETTSDLNALDKERNRIFTKGNIDLAWSKFKSGAVTSFGFVSPLGMFYFPKLISDSFGWTRPVPDPKNAEFGKLISGQRKLNISNIAFDDQLKMAKSALMTMGLTKDFASLVMITGHGSSSVNNPHATGLDCGACGGNSGEVNALTAQLILNDIDIRNALKTSSIEIPDDTYFVACIHDTTTDEITIINEKDIPISHVSRVQEIKSTLLLASKTTSQERGLRLGSEEGFNSHLEMLKRANDWAQVRPEWGLAGCHSFIISPRYRTKNLNLEGKVFLHSYNWESDSDYSVLETIMTAPMVVTSWINLQYYASTVDNVRLGSGNKTLHNVTSGLGVLEGSTGDLRIGLPLQSIHDGENYQHLPLRLNVIIEAPIEAINTILKKHSNVRDLIENKWINLMILNKNGIVSHRYSKNYSWEVFNN